MANLVEEKATGGNGTRALAPTGPHFLSRLRDEWEAVFDRFMSRWPAPFEPGRGLEHFWGLDVEDRDKEVVIRAEVPGFEVQDLDVQVSGNLLQIRAERKQEKKEKADGARREERSYGRYERSMTLPDGLDTDKVTARYHSGVLELHLPKTAAAQAKKIAVST